MFNYQEQSISPEDTEKWLGVFCIFLFSVGTQSLGALCGDIVFKG